MPSARIFLLGGALTFVLIGAVAFPPLSQAVLAADAALLALFLADLVRARQTPISAERRWPEMLVQSTECSLSTEVQNLSRGRVRIELREGLHPSLAEAPRRADFELAGGERRLWPLSLVPRLRGEPVIAPLTARVLGPWGLAWHQRDLVPEERRRIYPQVRWQGKVGQLLARAQRHQLGAMPLSWQGSGTEPYGLREYLAGDPLNRIHWKATARHGSLVSREHTWERGARLVILLDCGRAMTSQATAGGEVQRSKLDYALASALALTRVAAARGDRVTLMAFSDSVHVVHRVGAGSRGLARAYGTFFDLEARLREPAFDTAAERVLEQESRSATVFLMTSVIDLAAAELLRDSLLYLERRHKPVLVNLTDPELSELASAPPSTPEQAFAQVSALEILLANRRLAQQLLRAGVRVVSTPADRLALETLEAYLALFRNRRQAAPQSLRVR